MFQNLQCCEIRLHHVPLAIQWVYRCSNERSENVDEEDGKKILGGGERIKITRLMYIDDLVLWCELEEQLK